MNNVLNTNETNETNKSNEFNKTNESNINIQSNKTIEPNEQKKKNYDSISNDSISNDSIVISIDTDYANLIDKPLLDNIDNRKYLYYLLIITLCISFLILSCIIVFIIFTIISLSIYKINNLCPESNLWYFVLTSLLIFIFSLVNYKVNNTSSKYIYNILCYLIISSTLITWGTYELFYITCVNKISNTMLYNISIIYWIYNISFCGLNIGLLLGLLLCSINIYNIINY